MYFQAQLSTVSAFCLTAYMFVMGFVSVLECSIIILKNLQKVCFESISTKYITMYLVIEGVTNITLVHMKGIIRFGIIKLLINTFEALKLRTILLSTISLIIAEGKQLNQHISLVA